jgi:hypothetical protein
MSGGKSRLRRGRGKAPMGHKITLKGYTLTKDGKLKKKAQYSSVSHKIKASKSKRIKVCKPVIS